MARDQLAVAQVFEEYRGGRGQDTPSVAFLPHDSGSKSRTREGLGASLATMAAFTPVLLLAATDAPAASSASTTHRAASTASEMPWSALA